MLSSCARKIHIKMASARIRRIRLYDMLKKLRAIHQGVEAVGDLVPFYDCCLRRPGRQCDDLSEACQGNSHVLTAWWMVAASQPDIRYHASYRWMDCYRSARSGPRGATYWSPVGFWSKRNSISDYALVLQIPRRPRLYVFSTSKWAQTTAAWCDALIAQLVALAVPVATSRHQVLLLSRKRNTRFRPISWSAEARHKGLA